MANSPPEEHEFKAMVFMGYEDTNCTAVYQSITTMPQYHDVSFEEIRFKFYSRTLEKRQVVPDSTAPVPNMSKAPVVLPWGSALSQSRFTCSSAVSKHLPYESDTITFIVGTSCVKNFTIHRAAIVHSAGFVYDAMKDGWKTAEQGVIPLPEDDPSIFEIYQTWLYKHSIPTDDTSENGYEILVQAYILGDKLRDISFKDAIIDCITERLRSTNTFDLRLSNLVYDNTIRGSPLRRLWCDIYVLLGDASWFDDSTLAEPINADLLKQLLQHQLKFQSKPSFNYETSTDACCYHEHGTDDCYLKTIADSMPQYR